MKLTKSNLVFILILIIALGLKLMGAYFTDVGTDEMIYTIIPLNFVDANRIGTIEQSPLYFYMNGFAYKYLGGITALTGRISAILFGLLTVVVIYLLALHLSEKRKASMISAFLFSLSGYTLLNNTEMDMAAFCFALLSMLYFIKAKENITHYYFAAVFLAIGVLFKNIVLLFLPAYVLVYFWNNKGKISKGELGVILRSVGMAVLLMLPILIYNYLTKQYLGTTDYYFSNILGYGETVHQGLTGKEWEFSRVIEIGKIMFSRFMRQDALILVFGVVGSIYTFSQNKKEVILMWLSGLFFFLYMAGTTGSASHYIIIPMLLSVFSGVGVVKCVAWVTQRFRITKLLPIVIVLAVLLTIPMLNDVKQSKDTSITLTLRDYVHQNIPEDALVIIDPRIYRGIHAWVFNDRHYLEGSHFGQVMESLPPGESVRMPLYYVECGPGSNCGWKPEDFQRIFSVGEDLSNSITPQLEKVAEVKATHHFNIYRGHIQAPATLLNVVDQQHQFWYYPVGWKYPQQAVDYYEPTGFNAFLHGLAKWILHLEILIVLLVIPIFIWKGLRNA